jgi:hypothetical protein
MRKFEQAGEQMELASTLLQAAEEKKKSSLHSSEGLINSRGARCQSNSSKMVGMQESVNEELSVAHAQELE